MAPPPRTRLWSATIAITVAVALVLQSILSAEGDVRFASSGARVANLFAYFTMQSNLLVGIVCGLIATGRATRATGFGALCVAALAAITITGLVFHLVLAPHLPALHGAPWIANQLLHTVVPLGFVLGWTVLGPRGVVRVGTVLGSMLFPLGWLALTFGRGAIDGYYPYPFLDAETLGYGGALLNVAGIAALYAGVAALFGLVDRRRAA